MAGSTDQDQTSIILGLDRCRGGWVVARGDSSLDAIRIVIVDSIEPVIDVVRNEGAFAAIDIPIGLPDSEPRPCDREARRFLGSPRSSSVFPPPYRAALDGKTYEEASRLNYETSGRKITRQTFGIMPAIREVDRVIEPHMQTRIRECHPEVTFAILSGKGRGLEHRKKSAAGFDERREILRAYLPEVDIPSLRREYGHRTVGADDILDALAALVTAHRTVNDSARVFPESEPAFDRRGLKMEIVA